MKESSIVGYNIAKDSQKESQKESTVTRNTVRGTKPQPKGQPKGTNHQQSSVNNTLDKRKKLGKSISDIIDSKGLSHTVLATQSNETLYNVRNVLKGENYPISTLLNILSALNVTFTLNENPDDDSSVALSPV